MARMHAAKLGGVLWLLSMTRQVNIGRPPAEQYGGSHAPGVVLTYVYRTLSCPHAFAACTYLVVFIQPLMVVPMLGLEACVTLAYLLSRLQQPLLILQARPVC